MNQIDLKNKVAIITGGAQGFGYSMVERFSKSGAKVVIWDKDEELLKTLTLPENVSYELVDITSYDSVQNSTNTTLDKKLLNFIEWFSMYNLIPLGQAFKLILVNKYLLEDKKKKLNTTIE